MRALAYLPSYNQAPWTIEAYRGTPYTVGQMIRLMRGPRGERSMKVRRHTEQIVNGVRAKDYSSEVIAIYHWWCRAGRYTRDPLHVEMLRDPERLVDDALAGKLSVDCDEDGIAIGTGCLVIGAEVELITAAFRPPIGREPPPHTHVFCRAKDPRTGIWWVLDPVAGARTDQMLRRIRHYRIYQV